MKHFVLAILFVIIVFVGMFFRDEGFRGGGGGGHGGHMGGRGYMGGHGYRGYGGYGRHIGGRGYRGYGLDYAPAYNPIYYDDEYYVLDNDEVVNVNG